jgi:hypothetical protein
MRGDTREEGHEDRLANDVSHELFDRARRVLQAMRCAVAAETPALGVSGRVNRQHAIGTP